MALYTFYLQGHADEEKSETEESCCQEDRMAGGQLHIYLKVNGYIIPGKSRHPAGNLLPASSGLVSLYGCRRNCNFIQVCSI